MADQTHDPRLEKLLRDVLAAEVANLPLTLGPGQILERAEARRRAHARSRLRLLIFGDTTVGPSQLAVALGTIAVLAVAGVFAFATLRLDRTPVAAPLPTTPEEWSRVAIDAGPNAQNVTSLAASPSGLLAVVDVDDGPPELFASTDGQRWTQVPPDEHPPIGQDGAGWALVGSDRGFLLSNGDVWFSGDGLDWQLLASRTDDPDLGHGEMLGVAAGGPGYVAVGNGNNAWYSTDGSEWSLAQVPQPPTQFFESQGFAAPEVDMRGIEVAGDKLVAWGTASRHTEDSGLTAAVMWTSQDGRTWSNALDPRDGEGPNAMAAGPGGLAAVFDDSGQLVVRVSTDGSTWEQVADLGAARSEDADGMPLDLEVSGIAASDAGFVAAGGFGPRCLMAGVPCGPDEALIWTSADGRSWSRLPKGEQFAHAGASDIVSWGDRFVIGGAQDGQPVVWISGQPPAAGAAAPGPTPAPTATQAPRPTQGAAPTSASTTEIQDIMQFEPLGPIKAGTYFIDPDGDASTPLRVVYEVPAEGWSEWIGAAKFSDAGHSGLSITTVSNLVSDGCHDHTWADPPVGSSVDDLVAALADLAPFEVTSPPSDVTIYGYSGKHLAWTVPDLPVQGGAADDQRFTECIDGNLKSWVAFIDTAEPGDAFYGYTGPGYIEEFWILDVDGTRLMIAAETSADSPAEDIAERDAILDSIVIEPS